MSDIMQNLPIMLEGTLVTIEVFILTLVFSLPLGFPIALGEESKFKPLSYLCKIYVWIFRGTPLMLQLFFFYYFFPIVFGPQFALAPIPAATLTFILNYAAYFAEIYRGGMNSIDRGQHEAAFALGLTKKQTMLDIILPQTMKAILPPVFNETITLVKDTALIMSIGCYELMKVTAGIVSRTSDISVFAIAAAIYLVMTAVLTYFAGKLEKYFSRYDQRGE